MGGNLRTLKVNVKQPVECKRLFNTGKKEKNQYNKIFEKVKSNEESTDKDIRCQK